MKDEDTDAVNRLGTLMVLRLIASVVFIVVMMLVVC